MSFRRAQQPEVTQTHQAFTPDGSCFPSDQVPDNLPTRAIQHLLRKQLEGDLRPDEMVLEISRQPEAVQRMFPIPILAQWSTLSEYWQWPMAWASNPATSVLKHRGAGVPVEAKDEKPWLERVLHARRRHGEAPPPQEQDSASRMLDQVVSGLRA